MSEYKKVTTPSASQDNIDDKNCNNNHPQPSKPVKTLGTDNADKKVKTSDTSLKEIETPSPFLKKRDTPLDTPAAASYSSTFVSVFFVSFFVC